MKKIRKMSPLLPELVTGILLRLPVRSLLRFKCLSASLCTEIDSENFLKNHLDRSIQTKTRQKLIVFNSSFKCPSYLYYADFDDDLVEAFPLHKPLISGLDNTFVYGSCNGLLLLAMYANYQGNRTIDLAVWNPFTRRYMKLPLCPVQSPLKHGGYISFGLGYDSAHDDYKVVMISKVHDFNREFSQVWVFGLKSDFWRSLDMEDEAVSLVGRFANGALYWVCKGKNKCIGFDLAKEVLFVIPPLSDCGPATIFMDSLVVFRGSLYCAAFHDETVEYYLLVSDNGGEVVGYSWRKEFTMENVEIAFVKMYPPLPMDFSKDGDSILLDELNGVFWHYLENKTKQMVNIAGLPQVRWSSYNVCWESLVSVGKDGAFDGATEEVIIGNLK